MSYNESLNNNSNYPLMSQSEWDNAPWNQVDNSEREIEVTISVTLSKTTKIKVSDYEITNSGKDEDGEYFEEIDYSNCDLEEAVKEQIKLPQDTYKDWNIDDFEIIKE